jgi:hypothetical protein
MCAAELFHQRSNFSVDLAEIICLKLATLVTTSGSGNIAVFCFHVLLQWRNGRNLSTGTIVHA